MNSTVKSILTILALVLGFLSGGAGTFFALSFWNSHILHNPGRCFYPSPSPPEDGGNQA